MTNLKVYLTIVYILFAGLNSYGQISGAKNVFMDTSVVRNDEWKSINIGFPTEDNNEVVAISDSTLRIDSISKSEFQELSEKYVSKTVMDTAAIYRTDTSFTIRNNDIQQTLPSNIICECSSSSYGGFIYPLNLYLVNTVDMHNEIAYTNLIDSKTGKHFEVPSCCDQGPQNVLISPQNKFLLTYSSTYFEHDNCCVYLLKINQNKSENTFSLTNDLNINFDGLNIVELVWINETSFAMLVTEQLNDDDQEDKKIKYYLKLTIKGRD